MYTLNQIKYQLLAFILNNQTNPTDGPSWGANPVNESQLWVEDNDIKRNDKDTQENLAFQELNNELDSIKNDSKLISTYTKILGTFLEKVQAWEFPWLSEKDDDFQRLLQLYSWRFKELKSLSERGHQIEHIVAHNIAKLNETVDTVIQGWDISEQLDKAYETHETQGENQVGEVYETPELNSQEMSELKALEIEYAWYKEALWMRLNQYRFQDNVPEEITMLIEKYRVFMSISTLESDYERYSNLQVTILPWLREIWYDLDVAQRDEKIVWTNWEKLGDIRNTLVEKEFSRIKESGTDIQKKIIGEKLWYSKNSDEMLSHDDIWALAQNWVDLSKFLLVDLDGKIFDWVFKDNSEFVFSSGWRDDIDGYLISYILDFQHIDSINIWWINYRRDTDKWFKSSDNQILNSLRDGELIKISKVETLTEDKFKPFEENRNISYYKDRTSTLISNAHTDFQKSWINWFSFSEVIKALFAGDILTLAKQIEHFMEWRFHVDEETQSVYAIDPATWKQIPYEISEADMSLESLSTFPQKYKKNMIESARRGWISPGELINHMNSECIKYSFPPERFVVLIWKESSWRNWAASPHSTAKWFSQMLDGTWKNFWVWDRLNPKDQLSASLKYLNHIMQVNKCSPEDACAFYNTWEYFKINNSPVNPRVASWNSVIVNKIPPNLRANWVTQREYFIWAVAYYNELTYDDAKNKSSFA